MASQKPDSPTATERMQEEVQGPEADLRLDLLRPAHQVRNSDRLRFIAKAKSLEALLGDEGSVELDLDSVGEDQLNQLADFADFVTDRFARDEKAREEIEQVDFGVYMATVFGYVEQLGESMGSSS